MKIAPQRVLFILLILLCSRLGVAPEVSTITNIRHGLSVNQPQMDNDLIDKGPHFSMLATSNATEVLSGENAYLVCSVMNLGKSVVSFLRHSDMNLLSVGKLKYTQDPRYQVFHDEQNNSWTLKIKQARREDEGWFECQISSAQPIGHAIYLKVIEPEVWMPGEEDIKFVKAGSNLNLTCYISQMSNERKLLQWTRDGQEINHHEGGVFISTEQAHNLSTVSHLVIKNLTTTDSGRYFCSASAKSRTSVSLHVIDDEIAESVTLDEANSSRAATSSSISILYFCFIVSLLR